MTYFQLERMIKNGVPIHLSGIGGVSMHALAELLLHMGAKVQGSDRDRSDRTDALERAGAAVSIGHRAESLGKAGLVIRTAAVPDTNPEIALARQQGLPVLERAQAWGLIMQQYGHAVCIAGTHGKTSTTSMVATFAQSAGLDPTVMVGGDLPSIGGSLRIGGRELFVAEACEYKNSFLSFAPSIAVILNIDRDHLDFFSDTDDIIASFRRFAELTPEQGGTVIANRDDANTMRAIKGLQRRTVTFGMTRDADVYPQQVECKQGFYSFDVYTHGSKYCSLQLSVPGEHNLTNALASAACAITLETPPEDFAAGIAKYQGVGRRFEFKKEYQGAMIFDDYAHHPSEIEATLKAARSMHPKRVICVFQPHTYSRTISLLDEFAQALSHADLCVLTEIYAAREINTANITSQCIADKMTSAVCVPSFAAARDLIREQARPGDLIFTMGAGDVYRICDML